LVFVLLLTGCATSAPSPPPRPSVSAPLDGIRRVVVVASGESRFAVVQGNAEPTRAFDEVVKWLPYKDILVPIAQALRWGINWLIESDAASKAPRDVTPAAVVAHSFARTLMASSSMEQIVPMAREPVGDARMSADAIVRVSVPAWGVLRVQEGTPPVVGGFADVRAEMVLRETGVIVWRHEEDVTHPDRVRLDAIIADRAAARERLLEVLDRAGRRLANELVYAQGAR
jgi:hypothetical protein